MDVERAAEEGLPADHHQVSTLTNWLETSRISEPAPLNTTFALGQTSWEPSSSCQRPTCSTPNKGTPWTEVVVRRQKRAPSASNGGLPHS